MSIMNSKERKARNRGFRQGYNKAIDDLLEVANEMAIKEMKSYENGYKKMNKQIIKDAIKFHGADEQTTVCMEECAELIQAISKEKRGKHDKQHLIEEIADVYICLEMLMEIYNISSKEIESMIERKQQREIERMREQK